MTKYWLLILSVTALSSCAVSEDMIENKELYCSGLYQGIRAVGRVATEVVSGSRSRMFATPSTRSSRKNAAKRRKVPNRRWVKVVANINALIKVMFFINELR